MAETAHTKGPWGVSAVRGTFRGYGFQIDAPSLGGVAWVGYEARHHAESTADARLIAAAPDMLDALKAMYRAHHLHIFSPRGQETRSDRDTCRICGGNYRNGLQHITAQEGHPSDVKAEAARLARAAIARATGEKEPDQ
jgi:hypothetical protein